MFTLALLPSELLDVILLDIIGTSIHSVGLGRGTEWEVGVFTTLANISPHLEDVARGLAQSIFEFDEQENGQSSIHIADARMRTLHQLSQPDSGRWDAIATKYPDKYPSDIFKAYSLLNSAISLRHGSSGNPVNVFIKAQEFALNALEEMGLCRIAKVEIASALKLRCFWEKKILTESINLVHACDQITPLLVALPPTLTQSQWQSVSQDEPIRYAELSRLLLIVKGAAIKYEDACLQVGETQNMKSTQLPGVEDTIRKAFHLSQHTQCAPLTAPVTNILRRWVATCPIFTNS